MNALVFGASSAWQRRLIAVLERRGYFLHFFDSRSDFFEAFHSFSAPIVVICDESAERNERLSVLQALRLTPAPRSPFVLIGVAMPSGGFLKDYVDSGADDFFLETDDDDSWAARFFAAECRVRGVDGEAQALPPPVIMRDHDFPFGMFRTIPEGRMIFANQALADMLGYDSCEELKKLDLARDLYLRAEDREHMLRVVPETVNGVDVDLKRKDGSVFTARVSGRKIFDKDGKFRYMEGIIFDVSGEKRALDLLKLQRDLNASLAAADDASSLLNAVLEYATTINEIDCGGIYLVEEDSGDLVLAASKGNSERFITSVSRIERAIYEKNGMPFQKTLILHGGEYAEPYRTENVAEGLRATIVAPILVEGKLIATLSLGSRIFDFLPPIAIQTIESIALRVGGGLARAQAEENMRTAERNLFAMFHSLDDMVFIVRQADATVLQVNQAVKNILGYSRKDLIGNPVDVFHVPANVPGVRSRLKHIPVTGSRLSDLPLVAKDGAIIPVETRLTYGKWDGEDVVFAVVRDQREKRRVQVALHESEARYRAIVENAATGVALGDVHGNYLEVNAVLADMLGRKPEEIAGKHYSLFTHPDDVFQQEKRMEELFSGRADYVQIEKRYIRPDGSSIWARVSNSLLRDSDGNPTYGVIIVENIDARKRAEQALQKSEARLRRLIESLPDLVVTLEADGAIKYLNQPQRSATAEKVQGRSAFDFIAVKDLAAAHKNLERCVSEKTMQCVQVQDKNGDWWDCRVVPMGDDDETNEYLAICAVITESKTAADRIRESEAKLRSLFDNLPDMVFLLSNVEGEIIFTNRERHSVSGEIICGTSFLDYLRDENLDFTREALRKAFKENLVQTGEAADVFGRYWACSLVPIVKNDVVAYVMAICTDVTEQRLADEALREEQLLLRRLIDLHERDRQLIAYEIHDGLAQLLTAARFHMESFCREEEDGRTLSQKDLYVALELIGQSVDETRRLISGIRPPILDEAGVVDAVDYLICECRQRKGIDIMFKHDVTFRRLAPPLETAVFRIVQESLNNACNHSQSDFVRVELSQHDSCLRIKIRDEGIGFNPAAVDSSRFGLRGIRERARLLGGIADIQSAEGDGTSVLVELPLVPQPAEHEDLN